MYSKNDEKMYLRAYELMVGRLSTARYNEFVLTNPYGGKELKIITLNEYFIHFV